MDLARKAATKVLGKLYCELGKILEALNSPINKKVISLKPDGPVRGHVLLSYKIERLLTKSGQKIPYNHYGVQLSEGMAKTFVALGFAVDVISNGNRNFRPKKNYAIFIDTRMNFERLAPLLNKDCIKILYTTVAHPHFNNFAELKRLLALQERRHVTLCSRRSMPPSFALAIEYADFVIVNSEFGVKNFKYANKPIYLLPNAVPDRYPWLDSKDFEACRSRFLWLGSEGMVHKGLDLVLEAFAGMPEYHLTVCGPVANEKDFERLYNQELYHTPNIHTFGYINVGSPEFTNLAAQCVGLVYPSCSEGSAGAVITCLHAGLIPIISYESGVDVGNDVGVILNNCSIQEIKEAVCRIASLSAQELKQRSRKAWEFARANHTMENFKNQYKKVAEKIIAAHQK